MSCCFCEAVLPVTLPPEYALPLQSGQPQHIVRYASANGVEDWIFWLEREVCFCCETW